MPPDRDVTGCCHLPQSLLSPSSGVWLLRFCPSASRAFQDLCRNRRAVNVEPNWNVAPTSRRPVIRIYPEICDRRINLLTWGLVPHFTKDLKGSRRPINARAGTIGSSGIYCGASARRHCIVSSDLFYEWSTEEDGRRPFVIGRQDGQPLAFGGLWESWTQPDSTFLRT